MMEAALAARRLRRWDQTHPCDGTKAQRDGDTSGPSVNPMSRIGSISSLASAERDGSAQSPQQLQRWHDRGTAQTHRTGDQGQPEFDDLAYPRV